MVAQIFLVVAEEAYAPGFAARLATVVADAAATALLVRRGSKTAADYAELVTQLVPVAQAAGTAILVEDDVALAKSVGADGVHVTSGMSAVRDALKAIKPNGIVGAGPIANRHEAMTVGETDVDYLFFGPLSEAADDETREMAAWWADTFEVPAVLSGRPGEDAAGCEFLALGSGIWRLDAPAGGPRATATTPETA